MLKGLLLLEMDRLSLCNSSRWLPNLRDKVNLVEIKKYQEMAELEGQVPANKHQGPRSKLGL